MTQTSALIQADFDRIALLSENRPEWSIVDLAILSLGAINVPIYTTQAVEQVDYILSDSGAKAIFIANRRLFRHAQPALAKRPMEHLIFFEPEGTEGVERGVSLAQMEQRGREQAQQRPRAANRTRDLAADRRSDAPVLAR